MAEQTQTSRVMLVVVDESAEHQVALRFACLRASHTGGRVAMLYVLEPTDSQQWGAVEDLMREEKRAEAEAVVKSLSEKVFEWSGSMPIIFLREGKVRDELLKLIEEEPSISILVLGAASGPQGPGPLVTHLAGKVAGRLRIPVTIVPGGLTDSQLASLT
ncbi:MAG: universal stress protein [Alphaproteobacteria bacterium]|nr:universal stress protein [Alphaproteobacteria bacterium]